MPRLWWRPMSAPRANVTVALDRPPRPPRSPAVRVPRLPAASPVTRRNERARATSGPTANNGTPLTAAPAVAIPAQSRNRSRHRNWGRADDRHVASSRSGSPRHRRCARRPAPVVPGDRGAIREAASSSASRARTASRERAEARRGRRRSRPARRRHRRLTRSEFDGGRAARRLTGVSDQRRERRMTSSPTDFGRRSPVRQTGRSARTLPPVHHRSAAVRASQRRATSRRDRHAQSANHDPVRRLPSGGMRRRVERVGFGHGCVLVVVDQRRRVLGRTWAAAARYAAGSSCERPLGGDDQRHRRCHTDRQDLWPSPARCTALNACASATASRGGGSLTCANSAPASVELGVGNRAGQTLVEDDRQGVDIGGGGCRRPEHLLRRGVVEAPDEPARVGHPGGIDALRDPEIRQVGMTALGQQDVLWLDVAVDEPGCVGAIEAVSDRPENAQSFVADNGSARIRSASVIPSTSRIARNRRPLSLPAS